MHYGASLSIKQCRNFGINDQAVLRAAMSDLGLRRFRLMSYWDEIETEQGIYKFDWLDAQIKTISRRKGDIALCLGVRQPRWPENHWPSWTRSLSKPERTAALFAFIEQVIRRYRNNPAISSWQLENEALLKSFGENGDFEWSRLKQEFALVKRLDPNRPVAMTTSTSWGIPFRNPRPDIVGFSLYRITYDKGNYRTSIYQPWIFRLRALLIKLFWRKPSFIHELQAEPWGPKAIWEMSTTQQARSMNPKVLGLNIAAAKKIGLTHVDLWGLEWWFWLKQQSNGTIWDIIKEAIRYNKS